MLIQEYAAIGFSDMRNYLAFKENGDVSLDWSSMPKEATKAIAEVTQEVYYEGKGENAREVKKTRFKLHDKKGALDSLAARLWPVTQYTESKEIKVNIDTTLRELRVLLSDKQIEEELAKLEETKALDDGAGKADVTPTPPSLPSPT